ncbi:MAG: glycerol kinase [Thermotoga sp.]|nr:MAG: glycerol kinase [Thermotoga sp.]
MEEFILAIDQGTTNTKAFLINREGKIVRSAQRTFKQYYPRPGWIEHAPEEIWSSVMEVIQEVLEGNIYLAAVGITNQRETTIVWDGITGKPVYNAIVWQCRRTAILCEEMRARGMEEEIRSRTGLTLDPYFSATKVKWILDNVEEARKLAEDKRLLFGTVDSWLLWKLTGGSVHATDHTNASRTMLFNIKDLKWDEKILSIMDIPPSMLPDVHPSSYEFGKTVEIGRLPKGVPITGIVGDQQAALFGHRCFNKGETKVTYGTGSFILMNVGRDMMVPKKGLLFTLAASTEKEIDYAIEGSSFIAGAVIQWLRDNMGFIKDYSESEKIATAVSSTEGVYFIPAFVGLGAPYWKPDIRGAIFGITRGTKRGHIVRAALESVGYQVLDIIETMRSDYAVKIPYIMVDGGMTDNKFLMQFQTDIINIPIRKTGIKEVTAMGAAYLAGLKVRYWASKDSLSALRYNSKDFVPDMDESEREKLYKGWKDSIRKLLNERGDE